MKRITFLMLLFVCSHFLNAQTYYENYQDGLVVFQIKLDAKRIISTDKQVDFKHYELFTNYLSAFNIVEVKQLHPKEDNELLNRVYQIRLSDISKVDDVIQQLGKYSSIKYGELKELHHTTLTPNDQYFGAQYQWGLKKIQAEQAWDISTGNSNVVVAVTDNAINIDHPDLQNVVVGSYDVVDNDNDPRPCGTNTGSHGSHTTGTVGCETDNNEGIASIGYGISVMPIKIGDCSGSLVGGYDGIVYAANQGADVINMSWGGPGSSNYGQNVINDAWNDGSILVAAAGNDDVTTQFYPAAYNNVVTVAASNDNDNKSSFSNYGSWIDITAPGSNIYSTDETGSYVPKSGTSMASPLVAGLLGLMKSYASSATNTDLINCLYSSADDISSENPSYTGQLGSGRINANNAMNCLSSFNVELDASIQTINSPEGDYCSGSFTPEIVLKNNGGNTITSATITYDWGGSPQTYNWTGSLSTTQTTTITLPSENETDGSYTFTATVSNPNGNTDLNSSNDTATSNFSLSASGQQVTLNLETDCWGQETTWEITDNNNSVVANGGPYTDIGGGTSISKSICLASACYTFTIFDEYGDGMSGSQYPSCSVNGDYEMLDENSNTLFQMTASNADYGSEAMHSFCLTNNPDDAGIAEINDPSGVVCNSSIQPTVELQNFGSNTLTSVTISYQTSGGVQNYSWTGSLASGQTETVTLPSITVANGAVTITANTSNPNGNTDSNSANDQSQSAITATLTSSSIPFVEDFETNVFADGTWSLSNPDNDISWERASVGGSTPGSNAAKINFFDYQQSNRRDGMISPKIDFSGISDAQMTFDHAYRRFNQNAADSLIIYVSTDCGSTWDRIFAGAEDGSGSFATQTTNTTEFTPATADDWCFGSSVGANCFTVNLDAYVGSDVFVKFESYNAGTIGNNLYIDNINITGTIIEEPPSPSMTTNSNEICEGETINYTDQSSNYPTSWNWTFQGGSPATSSDENPSVTYANSGSYDVTLEVTNQYGTETVTFTDEVTVSLPPQVNTATTNATICAGTSTTISASGATSYSWDNGLGNGDSHTVSPSTTTTYEVTGSNGGCTDVETITINVDSAPSTPTISQNGSVLSVNLQSGETAEWFLNGNSIGSGDELTIDQDGVYTVVITGSNGCESSNQGSFQLDTSSLTTQDLNNDIRVYPNPTSGKLITEWEKIGKVESITVYDAVGRNIIDFKTINSNKMIIDLGKFETGIYTVLFKTVSKTYTRKITVK